MSVEKEIPFVIFLKSIYEVRPKKHSTTNKTHHWKLRIETLKSQNDIKRVEFILHNTFPQPIQIKKKPPFEIEEEGFGNFEMQINIKILNRKIPLPYFIHLLPHKDTTILFHHSVWMVKPNELAKVLKIGGVPMEKFENENDEIRALTKILEYVKRYSDRPLDPGLFYPKVYERVIQKIKRFEAAQRSSSLMHNAENDIAQSDDSSSTRQSHVTKPQKSSKHNLFDPGLNDKSKVKAPKIVTEFKSSPKVSESHKLLEFEFKKELKRKKTHYDSSSESDTNACPENLFESQKRLKKCENVPKIIKQEEIKIDNPIKPTNKLSIQQKIKTTEKPNSKQLLKDSNKLKLKLKDNSNSDSFNKLFEAQDILVVNRNKVNPYKKKEEICNKRVKQEPSIKNVDRKHLTPVKKEPSIERPKKNLDAFGDDNSIKKSKPIKQEERIKNPTKDCRQPNSKSNPLLNDSKSSTSSSKMKLPEKTMPDQKKIRESENAKISGQKMTKKSNVNVFPRTLSRSSSSDSEHGSIFSKSSSDNEIDHDMFKPKKKNEISSVDQTKLGVRQLFGDDKSDGSDDDDDQVGDIEDIFSSLKNSKKIINKSQSKHRTSSRGKSDDEISSDNDPLPMKDQIMSRSQSPDMKSEPHPLTNAETTNKVGLDTQHGPTLSYKERRRLAKQLVKINDKDFFEKLQRLLLTSYRNKEKSLRFDLETMKLDFHMGEISDHLALIIKSMVDEFFEEHHSSQIETSSGHDF